MPGPDPQLRRPWAAVPEPGSGPCSARRRCSESLALSPACSWQADVSWNPPALRPAKEQNGSAGPDGQGWTPKPWVKPALRYLYSPTQAAAAGSSGRLAFAMTRKLDARRRAPENNNLPPGSLLLFFPRYISRLGGTNHRKAPARWPQRRVTGRASQWPGLDFFLARPGRSQTCARVLSAMLLAAALVFFFSSKGANSVRNSRGARDVGTRPDTPSGSPAPAVPLRGYSRSATSGGDGPGQATRGLLIGEVSVRGRARGGLGAVVGRRGLASAHPTRLWLLGCSSRAAANLKGWGPRRPPGLQLPPPAPEGPRPFYCSF